MSYHGWTYKDGLVEHIPGIPTTKSQTFGVPQFEIQEINDDIYLRPSFDVNSQKGTKYNHTIYIPEANDPTFVESREPVIYIVQTILLLKMSWT